MDLGQIFTNKNVADYMMSLFCLERDAHLLDPCFGAGAFLEAARERGFDNIEGYEIDASLYEGTKSKHPNLTLYNKDFFKADSKKKYDGIIMNPPYIRQEKIDELKSFGISKNKLRKNSIFDSLPNTANMYMYFIFQAIELLRQSGQLVVIFPGSWMQAKSGRQFQEALYSKCTLLKQVNTSGEVFEEEPLVEVVILVLIKEKVEASICVENIEISNGTLNEHGGYAVAVDIGFDVPFERIGTVRRGLTTGCNKMYINPLFSDDASKELLVPIISSPKAVSCFATKSAKTDSLFLPQNGEILSEEIESYIKRWKRKIKKEKTPKTLCEKIGRDEHWYKIKQIDSKGILFGYFIRNDMRFIFNDAEYLARDNFYIISPTIDVLLAFALLNNYYTFFQLEKSGKRYGAGLLKVQRYDIDELKFPNIDEFSNDVMEELKALAQKLIGTGDVAIVAEISKILAKYSSVNYEMIIKQYRAIKKYRLEG